MSQNNLKLECALTELEGDNGEGECLEGEESRLDGCEVLAVCLGALGEREEEGPLTTGADATPLAACNIG